MRLTEKRAGPTVVKATPQPKKLVVVTSHKRPFTAVRETVVVRSTEKRGHNP